MNLRHALPLAAILFMYFYTGACAPLPANFEQPVSYAYVDTQNTELAKNVRAEAAAYPGKSGFHLLANGLDAFVARTVLARMAERSIDTQYYLLHDDLTGHLFLSELLKAADRGVRLFNPFSRKRFRMIQLVIGRLPVQRRMHNKSCTVDNQVSVVGGRNIGNEYFEANPDLDYSDLDVIGIGPVVRKVSASFDLYWNHELAYPATVMREKPVTAEQIESLRKGLYAFADQQSDSDYMKALRTSDLARNMRQGNVEFIWGNAIVLYDQPEKITRSFEEKEYRLSTQLAPYFEALEREVILISPYFAPGKEGVAFLKSLGRRGVRVRLLTNALSSNDVQIVHAGYAKYRKELLAAGVELYELNRDLKKGARKAKEGPNDAAKASLHAKSFVLDRRQVFIGSLNLDPRAVDFNTEIGILLESEVMAEGMAGWFDAHMDKMAFRLELEKDNGKERILWHGMEGGKPVTYDKDPYTSLWERIFIGFLGLLPIESQL